MPYNIYKVEVWDAISNDATSSFTSMQEVSVTKYVIIFIVISV